MNLENQEKEIKKLAKETEELFSNSVFTFEDTVEINRIRNNFKAEVQEAMSAVYLATKLKYINLEKDYLLNIKKFRMGNPDDNKH